MDRVAQLSSHESVVVFSKSSCCLSHTVKSLLYELGVSPVVYELDQDSRGKEMEWALTRLGCSPAVPAVFIGGRLVGSVKTLITHHVNGSLEKMLQQVDQHGKSKL